MISRKLMAAALRSGLLLVAVLCLPVTASAVSTVAISSGGDGVFTVQGIGIEGAAAFELNVGYDTATLANPRVVTGALLSGAMTAVNTNVAGAVRVVMIRLSPVSGSGVIATMTFDRTGASPGKITSLTAKLVNSQGVRLQTLAQIQNPAEVPASASGDSETRTAAADTGSTTGVQTPVPAAPPATAQTGGTTVIIGGAAERPSEGKAPGDTAGTGTGTETVVPPEPAGEQQAPVVVGSREAAPAAGNEAARSGASTRKVYQQKSVLDRFREYRGERTPEAFVALFGQEGNFWCRQDPPVALSDGKTTVRVTFITTPGKKSSSDIAVMGARLISLKQDADNTNTWTAEVVPATGEYRGSIAVLQGDVTMVCPLTIAPPVTLGSSRSGKGQGAASRDQADANKDGKIDYIDDYIITANYLAASGRALFRKE